MSKVGELLDKLNSESQERFPDKPLRIVVGRTETLTALLAEPGVGQFLQATPTGRAFAGIPLVSAGGTDRAFDFKIDFENDQK